MTTNTSPNASLAATAYWTAAVRARESVRDDRLFDDPWAAALAGETGQAWIAQRSEDSTAPIVLRTRYFDDFLRRITEERAIRQVVLMAAGLDTRAFRLEWPADTHLFELDQPQVLAYKAQTLAAAEAQPACLRQVVDVDLTGSWEETLLLSGYRPEQTSVWLFEGFLFYLPGELGQSLLAAAAHLAAPGSWLGFDIINSLTLTSPYTKAWIEMQAAAGAPWIGTLDDPVGFLAEHGCKAALTQAGQPEANHGRWRLPVIPTEMANMPHNWFVTAEKV
jgi:methyltransferase (TIGR00027 family)